MRRLLTTIGAAAVSTTLSLGFASAQSADPHAGHSMAGMTGMEHMRMTPAPKSTPKPPRAAKASPTRSAKGGSTPRRPARAVSVKSEPVLGDMPGMAMDHSAHTGAPSLPEDGMNHAAHEPSQPAMGSMPGMDHSAHGSPQPGMAGMGTMGGMHTGHGGMGGGDTLASSVPENGAVLAGPPSRLRLAFKSPVRLQSLQLFDSTGSRVPVRVGPTASTAQVSASLPTLPPDNYEARWRALDARGATLTGLLRFRVG